MLICFRKQVLRQTIMKLLTTNAEGVTVKVLFENLGITARNAKFNLVKVRKLFEILTFLTSN